MTHFMAGIVLGMALMGSVAVAYDDHWSVLSDPTSASNIKERLDRQETEQRLDRLESESRGRRPS